MVTGFGRQLVGNYFEIWIFFHGNLIYILSKHSLLKVQELDLRMMFILESRKV